MRIYERYGGIIGLSVLCQVIAGTVIVTMPALLTVADTAEVVDIYGNRVKVPPYTPEQAAGKKVYESQICWHCHSQFVRPVNDEDIRFGPVSQAGESAWDKPHLFGTRRIGPDLAREGGLRIDDWHFMHLFDPRAAVSGSVMPGFTWLFYDNPAAGEVRTLLDHYDYDGNGVIDALDGIIAPLPSDEATQRRLKGADRRGMTASRQDARQDPTGNDLKPGPDGKRPYVDQFTQVADQDGRPSEIGDSLVSDLDGAPVSSEEARNVVAYLQRLGTAIGPWRRPLAAPTPVRTEKPPLRGVTVKWTDSAGKQQEASVEDGQMPRRDRKRRLYGDALAHATAEQRAAARDYELQYDALMSAWRKANPEWDVRLAKGADLFAEHCASCHGKEGRGNGAGAQFLVVRPRDFTQAAFRYRSTQAGNLPLDGDLYRTLWRGLPGTAMPSWRELNDKDLWLLVDFVESLQEAIDGERGKEFDDQAAALAVPSIPKVNAEQLNRLVRRGKAVYSAAKCSNCHGTEGRGDGPGWDTKMDNLGRMRARDFKPRFPGDQPALRIRGGVYPQDLYRTIFTGLGGTAMASSLEDFREGWRLAAEVDRLTAAHAPAADLEAAKKAAKKAMIVPLWEDDLLKEHGVSREQDANGQTVESLDRLRASGNDASGKNVVGDDWALVFYVMDLLQVRELIPLTK